MEDAILQAVLSFSWSNYGFDELSELASEDPGVGVFDELASHIHDEVKLWQENG